jgi:Fe2+ or Zn2+ uptake regulation protein
MSNKLETLNDFSTKLRNRGGYFRCSICDSVSNEFIETNIGDYKKHLSFVNDPKDHTHFICMECNDSVDDLRQDYEYMDDWKEMMA